MTRYAVGSTSGWLVPLLVNTSFLAVFAAVVGVWQGRWGLVVVGAVLGLVVTIPAVRAGRYRLVVDELGVQLAFRDPGRAGGVKPRRSTWSAIHRLEVTPETGKVRVVLRADVPLPPWMHGRVIDPSDPESGPTYARDVPGLDPAAFEQTVRRLSPQTQVVVLAGQGS